MTFDIYTLAQFILVLNFLSLINEQNDLIMMIICIVLTYISNLQNPILHNIINIIGGVFTIITIMISSTNQNEHFRKIKMYLISFMMFVMFLIGYIIYDSKNNDIYYIGLIYPFLCYSLSLYCYNKRDYEPLVFINCIIHLCIYIEMYILLHLTFD